MDPTPTLKSTETPSINIQSLFPSEDPNLTISDDNNNNNDNSTYDRVNAVKDLNSKKCHGRWSNHEQLIFLKNLVNCKGNIKDLVTHLTSRNLPQIKVHTIHFIRMCKKEFAVSKTKQQNKLILNHICNNYGFHPDDGYLEQLEEIILNPSKELMKNLKESKLGFRKSMKNANVTAHANDNNANMTSPQINTKKRFNSKKKRNRGDGSKNKIFSIAKIPKKSPKVINIVTINVMTSNTNTNNSNINSNGNLTIDKNYQTKEINKAIGHIKNYGPNPFNIEFDPKLMSSKVNKEGKIEKEKMEEDNDNENNTENDYDNPIIKDNDNDKNEIKQIYNYEEDSVMNNIIQNQQDQQQPGDSSNLDSSMNDFDSILKR